MKVSDFELAMILKKLFKILFLSITLLLAMSFVVMLSDKLSEPKCIPISYNVYYGMGFTVVGMFFLAFKYIIKIVRR